MSEFSQPPLSDGCAILCASLLHRDADDPVFTSLRNAAVGAKTATSPLQLAAASEQLANAMMAVGLDRWPRFVAPTVVHARDPVTLAAVTKSLQPVPAAYAASGKPGSGSVGSGTSLAVGVENDPFLMPLEGGGEVMPHGGGAMPDMGPPSTGGDPGPPPAVEPLPLPSVPAEAPAAKQGAPPEARKMA